MYSQVGQDDWVLSLFGDNYKGFFVDIGCYLPKEINNTLLLEEHGWDGVSLDICDYIEEWKVRKTGFICQDVFECDFTKLGLPQVIDYLSVDIDELGANHDILKKIIDDGFKFKVITIEHNLYLGDEYNIEERIPQRELLRDMGYALARPDVADGDNIFEDWWVNSEYFNI